jgi:glycosyltransferase involved in cell wall biosynthesis
MIYCMAAANPEVNRKLVSVITPVHPPSAGYIRAAYHSLVSQKLPAGWTWEWIVQEDGRTGALAGLLPEDGRIDAGSGRRGGPGVARNLALARARGSLVKVLDADDLLTEGALSRDIEVLEQRPEVAWTASRALDLLPDGSTRTFDTDPEEGVLTGTEVLDHWLAHDYYPSVVPGTMCIRRSLLVALGGWMALPASEDTGLLIAASVVSDGYFLAETGLYYRKWQGQSTSRQAHTDPEEHAARMRLIEARAYALMETGWRAPLP